MCRASHGFSDLMNMSRRSSGTRYRNPTPNTTPAIALTIRIKVREWNEGRVRASKIRKGNREQDEHGPKQLERSDEFH
jgi:hypothetical protein